MKQKLSFVGIVLFAVGSMVNAQLSTWTLIGQYSTGINGTYACAYSGTKVYIPSSSDDWWTQKLDIVNIANPANPILLGSVSFPVPIQTIVYDIKISGNYAYLSLWHGGFAIIDISHDNNPLVVSIYSADCPDWGKAMARILIEGKYMYVSWDNIYGLGIFDISDPYNPQVVSKLPLGGYPRSVYKKDSYVFLPTYYGENVSIVNVVDPAHPQIVGSIGVSGSPNFGALSGNFFYLADCRDQYGFKIYDITDPKNPTKCGQYNTASLGCGWTHSVEVYDNHAYVTFNYAGVVGDFDITDRSNPVLSSILYTGPLTGNLQYDAANSRLYLSTPSGVAVFGQGAKVNDLMDFTFGYPPSEYGLESHNARTGFLYDFHVTVVAIGNKKFNFDSQCNAFSGGVVFDTSKGSRVILNGTVLPTSSYIVDPIANTIEIIADALGKKLQVPAPSTLLFTIRMYVTAGIGESIGINTFTKKVLPPESQANDSASFFATVQNSWDPNAKLVSPQGFIAPDQQSLSYFIQFENEGNADAINITVRDVLDLNLDEGSLLLPQIPGVEASYESATRTISWNLHNVNLPPHKTAMVYFSVNLFPDLSIGTVIGNKASIVFDANPPVETDEVVSIIGSAQELEIQAILQQLLHFKAAIETVKVPNQNGFRAKVNGALMNCTEGLNALHTGDIPSAVGLLTEATEQLNALKNMIRAQQDKHLTAVISQDWLVRDAAIVEAITSLISDI